MGKKLISKKLWLSYSQEESFKIQQYSFPLGSNYNRANYICDVFMHLHNFPICPGRKICRGMCGNLLMCIYYSSIAFIIYRIYLFIYSILTLKEEMITNVFLNNFQIFSNNVTVIDMLQIRLLAQIKSVLKGR